MPAGIAGLERSVSSTQRVAVARAPKVGSEEGHVDTMHLGITTVGSVASNAIGRCDGMASSASAFSCQH